MNGLPDTQAAIAALDEACGRVALRRLNASELETPPPVAMSVWLGTYAAVVLCPVISDSAEGLRRAEAEAEAWIAELLDKYESAGHRRVIDGYLVLAVPNEPANSVADEVRRIELSSQVCRKHVIWPASSTDSEGDRGSGWRRLDAVTAIALPQGVTAATGPVWPELTEKAGALWQKISEFGPVAAAYDEAEPS
jgi:hypothetical protein